MIKRSFQKTFVFQLLIPVFCLYFCRSRKKYRVFIGLNGKNRGFIQLYIHSARTGFLSSKHTEQLLSIIGSVDTDKGIIRQTVQKLQIQNIIRRERSIGVTESDGNLCAINSHPYRYKIHAYE